MKLLIISIFIGFVPFNTIAQISKIEFFGKNFSTDQTGSYYEIYSNQIKKIGKNGQRQFTYSNTILGEIASVDISNPMKILVFFKDFSKIVILDNTLSEIGKVIDLNAVDREEISLACTSYNNSLWYYNPVNFQLTRIENSGKTLNSSANISNILNKNIQPNFLVESNRNLYLNDPKVGVLIFDIYGTYIKTIPIYGLSNFQVKENYIVYVNAEKQIETYDFFTLDKIAYKPLEFSNIKFVRIENEFMYIINSKFELTLEKIDL